MKRILIVDDERSNRILFKKLLTDMGYDVFTACDGDEGLFHFVNCAIDLVLTDMDMPRVNGWSLGRQIKNRSPETPVLLVTGAHTGFSSEKLRDNPFDTVLRKPVDVEELKYAVNRFLPIYLLESYE